MKTTRSFCQVDSLISNVPGTNAPVGEISTYALTFSREIGFYQDSTYPGYAIYNFISYDASDAKVTMPSSIATKSLQISKWLIEYCLARPTGVFSDTLLAAFSTYAATINVTSFSFGTVVQQTSGYFPDWITWKDADDTDDNTNTIWFSISSFEDEYSDYEIVIVPPITTIDNFFAAPSSVKTAIAAINITDTIDAIQAARNGSPETIVRSISFNWVNPTNSSDKVGVNWNILIYGPGGNNIDAIKDALVTYIMANTAHTRAEWVAIFPDIFKRTEFVLVPNWVDYAIANMTTIQGIYSPIKLVSALATYFKSVVTDYDTTHVDTYLQVMSNPYKSMQIVVVGSAENRDSLFKITDVMPDYISVSSTSTDFTRMSASTQEWALMLGNLIIAAETMSATSAVPQGYTKVTRGSIVYAVKSYNDIQYLVATKPTVYTALGITTS